MNRLAFEPYVVPPDSGYPFYITANRYLHPNFRPDVKQGRPSTLLLMHSTSFHKEILEPTLADIFTLTSQCSHIREAWTIECPNHGQSAALNDTLLRRSDYEQYCAYYYRELIAISHT